MMCTFISTVKEHFPNSFFFGHCPNEGGGFYGDLGQTVTNCDCLPTAGRPLAEHLVDECG